jgi:hypothetical protein
MDFYKISRKNRHVYINFTVSPSYNFPPHLTSIDVVGTAVFIAGTRPKATLGKVGGLGV